MKPPSRLAVLTALLLVLLPTLAVLQYRWVGELGDAARERMQRNLHNAAQQFRESFDGEIVRAFVSLQADRPDISPERYAERYDAWSTTTPYPWLVSNVYLVDAVGGELRLRRWDAAARTFADAAWQGPLASVRSHFDSELAVFQGGERAPGSRPLAPGDESLLVAPLVQIHIGPEPPLHRKAIIERQFGFTVLHLNIDAIRDQLLPALAERHFSQLDDQAYRVAVVDESDARRVIFRSSPEAPVTATAADVSVPFFNPHADHMLLLARGAPGDLRQGTERRNVFVNVFREQRGDRMSIRSQMAYATSGGRWRLLAQHGRGSLDAAVGGVRQRNLLVSFGILLLMGVSVGLLLLSSRRAQRLARQQMEFVAGVSHELRTPVAVIRSAAENLSHGVVGDRQQVRRYGDAIQTEARRLGEMVERVLHFAGIESGRIARTPVALAPIVEEAIAAATPGGPDSVVVERRISPDLPPVLGDAASLRSAVQNLVVNAIKYGGSDRWLRITVEAGPEKPDASMFVLHDRRKMLVLPRTRRGAAEVRVIVEDHGHGIAPADLPHVFEPFYRGSNARVRQTQGSGLGLALVARIAAAHGGAVGVRTREGEGSTFTLHLPAAASTAEAVPLQSPNEAAAG